MDQPEGPPVPGEATLYLISIMGGANIYVPDTVEVEISGFSLMGSDSEYGARQPRSGAPVVQIHSYNVMGGNNIYRLPPRARGLTLREARRVAKAAQPRELPAGD